MFSFHFEPDSVCMVMFSDDDKAALIKFWVTTPEGRAIFLSLIVLSIKYKREKSEANWRLWGSWVVEEEGKKFRLCHWSTQRKLVFLRQRRLPSLGISSHFFFKEKQIHRSIMKIDSPKIDTNSEALWRSEEASYYWSWRKVQMFVARVLIDYHNTIPTGWPFIGLLHPVKTESLPMRPTTAEPLPIQCSILPPFIGAHSGFFTLYTIAVQWLGQFPTRD